MLAAKDLKVVADEGVLDARAGLRPTVDLRLASGWARTNNSTTRARATRGPGKSQSVTQFRSESNLTLSQLLFDGFGAINRKRAAESLVTVAEFQVFDAGELIGLRAALSYLAVARARRLVELADQNVLQHQDIVNRIRIQVEAGGTGQADLDQAQGRLELAISTQVQFGGNLRDSITAYLESIGQEPDVVVLPQVSNDVLPDDMNGAVQEALRANPALRAATHNLEARRKDLKSARSPFFPTVTFEVDGARNENLGGVDGPNNDFQARLVLNYNLYRGGGDSARLRSAKALASEALRREVETARLIEQGTRIAFTAYETAPARLPVLKGHRRSTEKALDAYYEQFSLGQRTLLDVLNVENELFGARAAEWDGRVALLDAHFQVLTAIGRLLKTLDTSLGGEAPAQASP